jgi:hypothetical protein
VGVATAILRLRPGVTGQRLDQNRRAGRAPQAARMSSFVHPAQHLYSRGSDFLIARLSRPRSFPPFSHEGHCPHMFRLSRLRIVTCWVMSNALGLNPTEGDEGGNWRRRFVDARHRDAFGPSLELGEGQTTRVPNQIKLSRHFAARTIEPVAVGSGTMHAQWTSDRVAIEALFKPILLREISRVPRPRD